MCYLLRATQDNAKLSGAALPPGSRRVRARWAGAAALTLIGSLAVAAAFVVTPRAAALSAKQAPAPVAVAARSPAPSAVLPAAAVVEQTAVPMDDDVPTAFNDRKAAAGECHHGM